MYNDKNFDHPKDTFSPWCPSRFMQSITVLLKRNTKNLRNILVIYSLDATDEIVTKSLEGIAPFWIT